MYFSSFNQKLVEDISNEQQILNSGIILTIMFIGLSSIHT